MNSTLHLGTPSLESPALPDFATLLVDNLKALNAKERDHLMRMAYLGECGPYEFKSQKWLSRPMEDAFKFALGIEVLGRDPVCVFAAMDYHLSWLHAALLFARRATSGLSASDQQACVQGLSLPSLLQQLAKQDPKRQLLETMDYRKGDAQEEEDNSLCPVTGSQEDVDLLVLFQDRKSGILALIFAEAKGVDDIDPKQFARKIVRLDGILDASHALHDDNGAQRSDLQCAFVWITPTVSQVEPHRLSCLERGKIDTTYGAEGTRPPLKYAKDLWEKPPTCIALTGFPQSPLMVTRTGKQGATYTQWRVKLRGKRKVDGARLSPKGTEK